MIVSQVDPVESHLKNHRKNQRATLGLLPEKALEVHPYLFLHYSPIAALFCTGALESSRYDPARFLENSRTLPGNKSAADDLRQPLTFAGMLVDRNNWQNEPIFGKMATVTNDNIFDHVIEGPRVDTDTPDCDFAAPASPHLIDFQGVTRFKDKSFFQPRKAKVLGQTCVPGKLAVLPMQRNEVPGTDKVKDEFQFLFASVP